MNILFDIGGTNMRLTASKDGQSLDGEVKIIPTPQDFNEAIEKFCEIAKGLAGGEKIEICVGGVPGPLNSEKTMVINAPNLSNWNNRPLAGEIGRKMGCKVILENDAALAALGEAMYGAGKGQRIVAYLTVGTGVGGARIIDGKIDQNILGFEPGHQVISLENSGNITSLEDLVSGKAVEKLYGQPAKEIKDEKIWDELAKKLAIGLSNTIVHWSPNAVVLGGSIMTKPEGMPLELVQKHLNNLLKIFPTLPQIKKAELGDLSGLYGALSLIKNF